MFIRLTLAVVIFVHLHGRSWSEDCNLEFINISDSVVHIQENEAFSLSFNLSSGCGERSTIVVEQLGAVVCTIHVNGRGCSCQRKNTCSCPTAQREFFSFNPNLERGNSGEWKWTVSRKTGSLTKYLNFSVTSLAPEEIRPVPSLQTEEQSTTVQPLSTVVQPLNTTATVDSPSTAVQPLTTTTQPPSSAVQPLNTTAGTVKIAVTPANAPATVIKVKNDTGTTSVPTTSSLMLVIVVVNSSIVVLLVCLAIIGIMYRNGRCGTPALPKAPQQPTQQQPQQPPPQQRELSPGGRQPSNHKPALPEGVITGQLLSPNVYDLINEDLVGAEDGSLQPAIEMQPPTSQEVYGEAYEETRPKPCGPRTGYLHPIPAKEDMFADLTGHPQSPRRPASRPRSAPVACSNMLYFLRK